MLGCSLVVNWNGRRSPAFSCLVYSCNTSKGLLPEVDYNFSDDGLDVHDSMAHSACGSSDDTREALLVPLEFDA